MQVESSVTKSTSSFKGEYRVGMDKQSRNGQAES